MRISFIGAGRMATAIACGLAKEGLFASENIVASDVFEGARNAFSEACGGRCFEDNATAIAGADIVVLSVKPQEAAKVLETLKGQFNDKLLISIAAGLKIDRLIAWTGSQRVIRVMPNTPAMVGMGASVFSCAAAVQKSDREITSKIFSAIGYACEMDEEKLDAVTALSGSGPAFAFAYVEAMVAAATDLGLDAEEAQRLCVQTMAGAAEMLSRNLGTPEELRKAVTSKGGTTAAGLASLEADDFPAVIRRCLTAATNRSIELGK